MNIKQTDSKEERESLDFEEIYSSSSPDEIALLKAAHSCGIELYSRNQKYIQIKDSNGIHEHQIIAVFEFNSDRKRMSVLTKDNQGIITLWSKGADNIMLERMETPASDEDKTNIQSITSSAEI